MSIRWSKGDYIKLGKAVADFNRQISQNANEENKLYLPKQIDYQALKNDIKTRQGLNAYIQKLKRINMADSFALETLEGGETVTRYQRRELQRALATVIPELEANVAKEQAKTLARYDKEPTQENIESLNKFEGLKGTELKKAEARLKDYTNLFNLHGEKFKEVASKLMVNQTEKKYRRAYQFRKNYMKVMKENWGNYRDYWIFKKYYADKHKDPVRFYEDLPDDSTYFPDDLYYLSDKVFTEEQFTAFVETLLGVSIDEIYEKEGKKKGTTGEDLKIQKYKESQAKKEKATVRVLNQVQKILK